MGVNKDRRDNILKIYALICPLTGQVRYIGKTIYILYWRLYHHLHSKKKSHKYQWIKSLTKQGLVPRIQLLKICKNEDRLNYSEKFFIKLYGRKDQGEGELTNHTNGGDGIHGYKHTEATKKKISEYQKGKPHSEEHNRRVGEGHRGKKHSAEHIEKCRKAMIGKNKGKPSKNKGKKQSIETVRKVLPINI